MEYPSGEEATVKRFEDFLPDLFIVSQVEIRKADERRFEIRKARGEKCMRCWQIKTDVGKNPSYPGVCMRCSEILDQLMVEKA